MKIILQRHAPTPGNLLGLYTGSTDEALAPEGIALARKVGPDMSVKRVYTSALRRTAQTAAILYPQAICHPSPDLNEMDFGVFEGQNWRELEGNGAYGAWLFSGCATACPGGESRDGFVARCLRAFTAILRQEEGAETVHFLVHGGTIMAIMHAVVQPVQDFFAWKAAYCSGFCLESRAGSFTFYSYLPDFS